MVEIEAGYMTGSGNSMNMFVYGMHMPRGVIPTVRSDVAHIYCHDVKECKGFNGGCPPYSPHFSAIKPTCNDAYVVCVQFDMRWAIQYSGWWKGVSAPGLYILVYADRLTMNYLQRLLKMFEKERYYTLGASNCPGCKPKDCTVTQGEKCIKPQKRRYSVEASGVNCADLHYDIFDEALPWWYRTPEHMPRYMYRYAIVFGGSVSKSLSRGGTTALDNVLYNAVVGDKYYVADIPEVDLEFEIDTLSVPISCHYSGESYEVYRIPVDRMGGK